MDCQKASILMMEYIDGTINESDKISLLGHIEECEDCNEEFSLLVESIDLVENMEELEPPEDMENLVMSSIDLNRYSIKTKVWNITLALFATITIMMGTTAYVAYSKLGFLKEVFIALTIKVVNFIVLNLPQLMSFIDGNLLLVFILGMGILSILMGSTITIAVAEVYIIKKFGLKLRRG
ncbi:anti-sigma factor family protein [Sporosalibacterium faouarense]|uniref:anti-sigma factor family protein n=1 Tax=Sporosalibacterium faouarense TaxID=516123 RepID=UPI00141D3CDB|nr:zf-HC2 domain-containing protein [Sporosalibacterium faouarense]MTI46769.1 zf-HC2 domain-containing protein [Bacillota bacterium]